MINRKKIIVGAWKAYLTKADAESIARGLKEWRVNKSKKFDYDIVLSPSFPYLTIVHSLVDGTDISLSAQDVDPVNLGAFTGHIPPQILTDVGCQYVILGHSEQRHLKQNGYKEINEKVKTALDHGLKVVLCIGETSRQRITNQTYGTLKDQIESALVGLDEKTVKNNLSIAYEPIWAISSQNPTTPPTPEEITTINKKIRSVVEGKLSKEVADTVRLLYGGSVNADNVCGYLNAGDIDGVLVGSASIKLETFIALLNAVEEKVLLVA